MQNVLALLMTFYILQIVAQDLLGDTVIVVSPEDTTIVANSSGIIRCSVISISGLPVNIVWIRDGRVIDFNTEKRFVHEYNRSLTVKFADEVDTGFYTCYANTSIDSANATAMLHVQDVPVQPEILSVECFSANRTSLLRWKPRSSNNSPILRYIILRYESSRLPHSATKITKTDVPESQTEWTAHLLPWTTVNFQIIAVNKVGNSIPSYFSEKCLVSAARPSHNPINVYGKGTKSNNLVVYWKPMLPIEHNGPNFYYRIYYRQMTLSKIHHIDVKNWKKSSYEFTNQKTFVPFIIRVEARNKLGKATELAQKVSAFSGEGVPLESPHNLTVRRLINNKAEIHWSSVDVSTIRGHFLGYKIKIWTETSSSEYFLAPFTTEATVIILNSTVINYLCMRVFNSLYDGPCSNTVAVYSSGTEPPPLVLNVPNKALSSNGSENSKFLEIQPTGIGVYCLTWNLSVLALNYVPFGYRISLEPVNETESIQIRYQITINKANVSQVLLKTLYPKETYLIRFVILTAEGEGVPYFSQFSTSEKDFTPFIMEQSSYGSLYWFIALICMIALIVLIVIILASKRLCFRKKMKVTKHEVSKSRKTNSEPSWRNTYRRSQETENERERKVELQTFMAVPRISEDQFDLEEEVVEETPVLNSTIQPFQDQRTDSIDGSTLNIFDNYGEEDGKELGDYKLDEDHEFHSLTNVFLQLREQDELASPQPMDQYHLQLEELRITT